jgi:hypothetical protein
MTFTHSERQSSEENWKVLARQHWENNMNMGNEADRVPNIADQRQDDDDDSSIGSTNNMVQWRGNIVPEKEAKALRHVFDNLQDHFGHQRADPNVLFNASLAHPGQGDTWRADLDFTYNINGEYCNLAYIGMDVCIDLSPKLVHKHGRPMLKDYGETWVYVYLPEMTMDKVKAYVKTGTGWDVSNEGTVYDPNRNVVAIEAKLNHQSGQPKPSFWVVKDNASAGEDISFSRIGSVQEVNRDVSQKHTHRGVGIFSVSMEVEGTPDFRPTPGMGEEATLVFTLVSVRTWGVTDCIAPIVHAPIKW